MKQNLSGILKEYKLTIAILVVLTVGANGLTLAVPKLVSSAIDAYTAGTFSLANVAPLFIIISLIICLLSYLQSVSQTYAAERVARDMRGDLAAKISELDYAEIEKESPSRLLTNLTSDIDAIKLFISNAMPSIVSSLSIIIGASVLLLSIDWKLGLAVLAVLPFIAIVFGTVFKRIAPLFKISQDIIDKLNADINESIMAAGLIRVFDSGKQEQDKFQVINTEARDNGLRTLKLFSIVIPSVGIIANMATVVILSLGGYFVISGAMTIGDLTAFNSYLFMLIFPIIILGFMTTVVSRAQASYARISQLLHSPLRRDEGTRTGVLKGDIEAKHLTVMYGEKAALRDVSFKVKAGTKAAIVGPTAGGKTQLLSALIGLVKPTSGAVLYDGMPIESYKRETLHDQVGLVFQDSIMFNMSLRDNVAFSPSAKGEAVEKAIETAELGDFVHNLPQGLDTVVSERGTSLSGGQKQRVMLARALALDPKVLLLDDFTARVDAATEEKILANLARNYPHITVISVTQKISSAKLFDQVILLMEGEVLAAGTHEELARTSPEYAQIMESQKSTNDHE